MPRRPCRARSATRGRSRVRWSCRTPIGPSRAVAVLGMGGSAIGGDLVRGIWSDRLRVPDGGRARLRPAGLGRVRHARGRQLIQRHHRGDHQRLRAGRRSDVPRWPSSAPAARCWRWRAGRACRTSRSPAAVSRGRPSATPSRCWPDCWSERAARARRRRGRRARPRPPTLPSPRRRRRCPPRTTRPSSSRGRSWTGSRSSRPVGSWRPSRGAGRRSSTRTARPWPPGRSCRRPPTTRSSGYPQPDAIRDHQLVVFLESDARPPAQHAPGAPVARAAGRVRHQPPGRHGRRAGPVRAGAGCHRHGRLREHLSRRAVRRRPHARGGDQRAEAGARPPIGPIDAPTARTTDRPGSTAPANGVRDRRRGIGPSSGCPRRARRSRLGAIDRRPVAAAPVVTARRPKGLGDALGGPVRRSDAMHSSVIGKVEKANRYARELDRIRFERHERDRSVVTMTATAFVSMPMVGRARATRSGCRVTAPMSWRSRRCSAGCCPRVPSMTFVPGGRRCPPRRRPAPEVRANPATAVSGPAPASMDPVGWVPRMSRP